MSQGKSSLGTVLMFAVLIAASPALAATYDCSGKLKSVWVGDAGHVWLHFQSGMHAHIPPANADQRNILSLATSALLADKWVTVRYVTSLGSSVCTLPSLTDYMNIAVQGIYLQSGQP